MNFEKKEKEHLPHMETLILYEHQIFKTIDETLDDAIVQVRTKRKNLEKNKLQDLLNEARKLRQKEASLKEKLLKQKLRYDAKNKIKIILIHTVCYKYLKKLQLKNHYFCNSRAVPKGKIYHFFLMIIDILVGNKSSTSFERKREIVLFLPVLKLLILLFSRIY